MSIHKAFFMSEPLPSEQSYEDDLKAQLPIKEVDDINTPAHYTHGSIEPIEAIEDWNLNFRLANTVKYIARCEHKGNKLKDLRKALWYLKREIRKLEESA